VTVTALDSARGVTIGGSSAAAACGVDPYRSRVMLWAELTGRIEREESEAMQWGNLLQPLIVTALHDLGIEAQPTNAELRDDARPWLIGHPDGFIPDTPKPVLLEVKTAGTWAGREWHDGDVPIQYAAQVQHYLHLTGLERALLACLVGGQRLITRTLERDDAAISLMLDLEAEFFGYVVSDTPPPPDGSKSSAEALAAMFDAPTDSTVRLTREQLEWLRELKERKAQLAAVKEQTAELENRLKLALGNATTAIDRHDNVVLRWTPTKRRALDAALLKAERPELAELFTTTTETRRFSVA
jgi:putative phage-type endonuclease